MRSTEKEKTHHLSPQHSLALVSMQFILSFFVESPCHAIRALLFKSRWRSTALYSIKFSRGSSLLLCFVLMCFALFFLPLLTRVLYV